jgi:hypothetical protein
MQLKLKNKKEGLWSVTPVNVCWSSSLLFCSTYINNFTATFHSLPSQIRTIFALWGVVARFDLNKFGNLSGSQTHNLKGPKLTLKNINHNTHTCNNGKLPFAAKTWVDSQSICIWLHQAWLFYSPSNLDLPHSLISPHSMAKQLQPRRRKPDQHFHS